MHEGVVAIRVLGRFEVCRGGVPVADAEWRSRKARDLVKILLARRGRACPRGRLTELLWRGEDHPAVLGNRLSVAPATVRRVLGPVVLTLDGGVALDLDRLDVDVESFLRDATEGLRERAAGRPSAGLLTRAAGTYRGDALEEDLYADRAHGLREEARAGCLAVLRALATDTADPDLAVLPLRLLDHDLYDEPAHRLLVTWALTRASSTLWTVNHGSGQPGQPSTHFGWITVCDTAAAGAAVIAGTPSAATAMTAAPPRARARRRRAPRSFCVISSSLRRSGTCPDDGPDRPQRRLSPTRTAGTPPRPAGPARPAAGCAARRTAPRR